MRRAEQLQQTTSQSSHKIDWVQLDQFFVDISGFTLQERRALSLLWKKAHEDYVLDTHGFLNPRKNVEVECDLDVFRTKEFIDTLIRKIHPEKMIVCRQESVHLKQVPPDEFLQVLFFHKLAGLSRKIYSRNIPDEVLKVLSAKVNPIGASQFHIATSEYKKSYLLAELFSMLGSYDEACPGKGFSDSYKIIDGRTGREIGIYKPDDTGPFKLKNTRDLASIRNRALWGLGFVPSLFTPKRLSNGDKILEMGASIWGYGDLPNIQGGKAEVAASIVEKFLMRAARNYIDGLIDQLSPAFKKAKDPLKKQFQDPFYKVGLVKVHLEEFQKQLIAHLGKLKERDRTDPRIENDLKIIQELLECSCLQGYRTVQETQLARFNIKGEVRKGSFQLWFHPQDPTKLLKVSDGMDFLGVDKFYKTNAKTSEKKIGHFPKVLFEIKAILDLCVGNFDGHPENMLFLHAGNQAIGFRLIDHALSMGRRHPSASKELEKMYGWETLPISEETPSSIARSMVAQVHEWLPYLLSDLTKLYDEKPFDDHLVPDIRNPETKAILSCFVDRFSVLEMHMREDKPYRTIAKVRTGEEIDTYRKILNHKATYEFSHQSLQSSHSLSPPYEEPSKLMQFSMSFDQEAFSHGPSNDTKVVIDATSPSNSVEEKPLPLTEETETLKRNNSSEQFPVIEMTNFNANESTGVMGEPPLPYGKFS